MLVQIDTTLYSVMIRPC